MRQPMPTQRLEARSQDLIRVLPMRRRHLRGVMRIESQGGPGGWSVGLFLAELGRTEGRVYRVAKVGTTVVGFAGLLMVGDEGHVTTIAVDQTQRGRRVGTRLLYELVQESIGMGAEALTLEVRAGNDTALALYRRFGFVPAGARANYYTEPVEDALILWASDVQSHEYARRLDTIRSLLAADGPPDGSTDWPTDGSTEESDV